MMSSVVDVVLLVALLATTTCVVLIYRKLKRLDGLQSDFRRALEDASAGLTAAREAMTNLQTEGRETVARLAEDIGEAKRLITELDTLLTNAAAASRTLGARAASPPPPSS